MTKTTMVLVAVLTMGCAGVPVDGIADVGPETYVPVEAFPTVWSDETDEPIHVTILADAEPPAPIHGLPADYAPLSAVRIAEIAERVETNLTSQGYSVPEDCLTDVTILVRHDNAAFMDECGSETENLLGCYQAPGREHSAHDGAYAIVLRWDIVFGVTGLRDIVEHEFTHRALECITGDANGAHDHEVWSSL